MGKKYGKDEDFKNDYYALSISEIAEKYQYKSESSIYARARRLGLKTKNNQWTKVQIDLLKEYYPNSEWETLLDILSPFGKEDIITKAYKLKIKRTCYGYTPEDEEYIIQNYHHQKITDMAMHLGKTPESLYTKVNKMGLVKYAKWSKEDIEKLRSLYPYYTNAELQTFFPKRSLISISCQATMKMKLTKDTEYLQSKRKQEIKESLLNDLKSLAENLGRTPTGDDINRDKNLAGLMSYHRYFGSYSEACKSANLPINACIFGQSVHCVSKNGDVCLSKKEKEITDFLIDNDITYEKEVLYKDIIEDYNEKNIRCDWLINKKYIVEYFGMTDKDYYKTRMIEKQNICDKYGYTLISLFEDDVKNNLKKMIKKFEEHGIGTSIPPSQYCI